MSRDRIFAIALLSFSVIAIALYFLPGSSAKSNKNGFFRNAASGMDSKNKILLVSLNGLLTDGQKSSVLGLEGTEAIKVRRQLQKAIDRDSIKGVLIRINSPGGTVGISQEIYHTIMNLRQKKPVVASMGDIAASGGYYIASACDQIYANPGTLTGSIGVIMQTYNAQELMKKVGLEDVTIKAGKYKDIGSFSRPMNSEERGILQSLIDDTYQQFLDDVYQGRSYNGEIISRSQLAESAQGLIYTGKKAHKIGLVDRLGGYQDALDDLQKAIKDKSEGKIKKDLSVITYIDGGFGSIKEMFSMSSPSFSGNALVCFFNPAACQAQAIKTTAGNKNWHMPIALIAPEFLVPGSFEGATN